MAVGRLMKDAYEGLIRTGHVVEDLGTHWRVDWGPNRTRIRKDRVGVRPKKQGPWWIDETAPPTDWKARAEKSESALDTANALVRQLRRANARTLDRAEKAEALLREAVGYPGPCNVCGGPPPGETPGPCEPNCVFDRIRQHLEALDGK